MFYLLYTYSSRRYADMKIELNIMYLLIYVFTYVNTVEDYWSSDADTTSFLRYDRNNTINSRDDNQTLDVS